MDYNSLFISITTRISELLESSAFLQAYRFPNRFVRKGKLSMYHIILFLFNSTRQAMHQNLENIFHIKEVDFPDVSRQAVSKARQGIMPALFEDLFNLSANMFYQEALNAPKKLWKGIYNVFAIDGSRLQLPNSKSNFEHFSEMFSKDNPLRRWSLALASTIYDVCNDVIAHGIIMPYLSSERDAALRHCGELEGLGILNRSSILVFDRGYYSEDMFRYFSTNGYLCLMRLKEGFKLSKDCKGDSVFTLPGDPTNGIPDVQIRVIRVDLGNGTIEYLGTNVFDSTLSEEDFKELYFLRWPIESKYYELKTQFKMEEFNGATSVSVEQEFFLTLLLSNLASLVKSSADAVIKANANPENEFDYQANRAFIIGRLKKIIVPDILVRKDWAAVDRLFLKASQYKSQIQPDRNTPRKKIKKDRNHFKNRKTAV